MNPVREWRCRGGREILCIFTPSPTGTGVEYKHMIITKILSQNNEKARRTPDVLFSLTG